MLANCHLHVDHSGGNRLFPDRPIFAQGLEYEAAHEPDYTVPEDVADFPGATFELHDGEADMLPGIRIVPTPGHVPGHQSLLVETREGRVAMAGQSFNSASEFGRAQFAWHLATTGQDSDGPFPEWIHRIQEFDPAVVLFAHDTTRWEAGRAAGL
jgi:N-acyl homoserine lactone hydrolase